MRLILWIVGVGLLGLLAAIAHFVVDGWGVKYRVINAGEYTLANVSLVEFDGDPVHAATLGSIPPAGAVSVRKHSDAISALLLEWTDIKGRAMAQSWAVHLERGGFGTVTIVIAGDGRSQILEDVWFNDY